MTDSPEQLEFQCPECQRGMKANPDQAGKRVICPACQKPFEIPSPRVDFEHFENIFEHIDLASLPSQPDPVAPPVEPAPSQPPVPNVDQHSERPGVPEVPVMVSGASDSAGASGQDGPVEDDLVILEPPEDPPEELLEELLDPEPLSIIESPEEVTGEEVDHSPIRIDGIDAEFAVGDVWGIRCQVCDTRIHVNAKLVGQEVECPICFTKVEVKPLENRNRLLGEEQNARWPKTKPVKSQIIPEDELEELRLSQPPDRPKSDLADGVIGVEIVHPQLVDPEPDPTTETPPGEEPSDDPAEDVFANASPTPLPRAPRPKKKQPTQRKTRRQLYEEIQSRKTRKRRPPDLPSVIRPKLNPADKPVEKKDPVEEEIDDGKDKPLPEITMGFLFSSATELLRSRGMKSRLLIAAAMLGVGSAAMHHVNRSYAKLNQDGSAQLTDWLSSTGAWLIFGGLPYLAGVIFLWTIASLVFRDTARGRRRIRKFGFAGSTEWSSTFWLFTFSFVVAGLPATLFWMAITPMRILVAPPLLLSAWFNKHPFAIVALDAFQTVGQDFPQWKALYGFNLCVIVFAIIGGMLMSISVTILSVFTSVLGAVLLAFSTLLFAAATGWHCGRVVQQLENKASSKD